jgi:hypothetical protein
MDEPTRFVVQDPMVAAELALRAAKNAMRDARATLNHAEQFCRYHGQRWDFLGWEYGLPRCDSCKQPYRVVQAIAGLTKALGDG